MHPPAVAPFFPKKGTPKKGSVIGERKGRAQKIG
jgi:hypothetical protein